MILTVKDLTAAYAGHGRAVDRVGIQVQHGETLALVGESGCGKTTLVKALMGLLPPNVEATGSARLDDGAGGELELIGRDESDWRGVRGRAVAIVPQGAMAGLSPVHRVGAQLTEMIDLHKVETSPDALLDQVGLDLRLQRAYPHELSGGMRQRVAIALALAGRPRLLIADEPTTGLDALTQRRVLELLASLELSTLVVSHDIASLAAHADRVAVMYAGRIAEVRPTRDLEQRAAHPYTQGLLAAAPSVDPDKGWASVPGATPSPRLDPHSGCPFTPRCPLAIDRCRTDEPEVLAYRDAEVACHLVDLNGNGQPAEFPVHPPVPQQLNPPAPVIRALGVGHVFRGRSRSVTALHGVDLTLAPGEMVALVGESGSGKSTLARIMLGLLRPAAGHIEVDGTELGALKRRALRALQHRMGFVSQDPYDSLHPAMRVAALVAEPLVVRHSPRPERDAKVADALNAVGLPFDAEFLRRFPRELSGGQRQRVAIARAIVADPILLIADEATSMLDVSTRAGISAVLRSHATERGLAVLFVTHDIGEAVQSCDRIAVLRSGELVDQGPAVTLTAQPKHTYTTELLAAARSA